MASSKLIEPNLRELALRGPVHFMGIAGAGMCALAELVLRRGGSVTGCDLRLGSGAHALETLGARIVDGHDAAHVADAVALVVTAAVPSDHPEVRRARARGIPVLKRAEALGALVNRGTVVAVAGTHGKTTTTAMTTEVLAAGGFDPTGFVGGRVIQWQSNLRAGGDVLFVVEADEYDRSFHALWPTVAVVTTVDADHLDTYGSLDAVRAAFATFVERAPEAGRVICCADDPGAAGLLPAAGARGYSYGLTEGAQLWGVDARLSAAGGEMAVVEEGEPRGTLTVSLPGLHNLRNALAAAAVGRHFGLDWPRIRGAIAAYRGVARRFERLGEARGALVVDDYAHHPTEIEATIAAARSAHPDRPITVVFQPHLYTRTRDFAREFGHALAGADQVWVTDVYPAREVPIPGITGEIVARTAREAGAAAVTYYAALDGLARAVADSLEPGDFCLVLGAGSIERIGPEVLAALRDRNHA
ncbi:MAG: UDP-N-acetylmuramate--L-alanine ligase [Gemmatimonadetes bacterium]|nr:UDP-N-acetylmuramate--L-alanine ligase [Gemmatimonadota bacterium]